ncbi:MAG TPA: Tn3 family transposase [Candidatus Xenobia bacterium]
MFIQEVDWELIAKHWQDMMQVMISIQAGRVLPSLLLRKLSTYNRKNRLYRAFCELGRVERTLFLLQYISKAEVRFSIRHETTKVAVQRFPRLGHFRRIHRQEWRPCGTGEAVEVCKPGRQCDHAFQCG